MKCKIKTATITTKINKTVETIIVFNFLMNKTVIKRKIKFTEHELDLYFL